MFARSDRLEVPPSRWQEAQVYERAFWRRLGEDIEAGSREQLGWYEWRANRLVRKLSELTPPPRIERVLEIGSGPIGIVNFLDAAERTAIDPLENFYRTRPALVGLRKPGVTYHNGTGEALPFPDGAFSLVIIDNVIDHTTAPPAVLGQIRRVLAPAGCLYLSVNVHKPWGAFLHTALAVLHIDRGHPHTFTSRSLRKLLRGNGFVIRAEHIDSYVRARREDRTSRELTDRIKGWTGLSEFSHLAICRPLTRGDE